VLLVLSRRYEQHLAQTGKAWAPDNPEAYLDDVCDKVALNHFKMKRRRPAIERGVEVDETSGAVSEPGTAVRLAQLLAIFERERESGRLPAEEAEVFEGRVLNDMTFPKIAAVLGRPLSTVQTQYARAVEKLRKVMARAS
jgi:DNA-directed RNA polymerase specialized sigma24 family protein